jgi:Ca2+-binding RTX toxin-like protein
MITGLNGDDTIFGGEGSDTLDGGQGSDIIDGGIGNDYISGGEFINYLTGGMDNDTFEFNLLGATINTNETDVIVDFVSGIDKIKFVNSTSNSPFVNISTAASDLSTLLKSVNANNITNDGKMLYYFGIIGVNGYLVTENDAGVISNIIKLMGVTNINASTDILGT